MTTTTTTTTATKVTTKGTKVRTAPAIPVGVEDFPTKVRNALALSVSKGVGEVRVKVTDPDNRAEVRKIQKRVQGIGYNAGYNANFRVTLAGDVLTGRVVDLTRDAKRPGETDPTDRTPGTRETFRNGWTAPKVTAWKATHVPTTKGTKVETKTTKGSKSTKVTKGTKVAPKGTTKRVTKVTATKVTPDAPKVLAGTTGPVDTKTVTVTKVADK